MNLMKLSIIISLFVLIGCSGGPSQSDKLAGYIERGDMYYEAGDFDNLLRAEHQYRRALTIDPTNGYVLFRLGNIYYIYYEHHLYRNERETAWHYWNISYNCFNEALKREPHNPDLYFGLATLNYCIKKYDEGIKLVQKVITLSSADIIVQAQAHRELGRFYNAQEKYSDALREFKEYLQILPDAPDADNIKMVIKMLEKEIKPEPEKK